MVFLIIEGRVLLVLFIIGCVLMLVEINVGFMIIDK